MNIALIGYGKMGKEIEHVALSRGHKIVLKVDITNASTFTIDELRQADIAIEFSTPESAIDNIYKCFDAGIPIVVGTTGWMNRLEEVKQKCAEKDQTLFYASNYSIGVNLFFKLNQYLAKLMNSYPDYTITMEEIHHVHKLDAPSGTAISLANQVIELNDNKNKWVNNTTDNKNELSIISKRIDEVPGTHTVTYSSPVDEINITHIAHSRKGFALGAVLAAEFTIGKKGVFGMNDLLK
ncbi:MAG: 4-hydroxy-tetrahydrodipicolinate reductase [Bacteroidetes bacterium RIFCSPLOWO2_12_FULL_35_15]|nr:MAG: 4-hydroxy-tetrahydrodipicolinate reductase [Bacteroidetes bacterium RIFCSPLOWO2_12_FULL_35_15]